MGLLARARALVRTMRTQLFIFVGDEQDAVIKYGDSVVLSKENTFYIRVVPQSDGDSVVPQSDQSSSPPAAEEKRHVAVSGMFVNDKKTDAD